MGGEIRRYKFVDFSHKAFIVCCCRAEVHGEDMLRHISRFLKDKSSNPLPVAMVIEGLVSLCQSEVTDVATLWGVLGSPHHSQWRVMDDNRLVEWSAPTCYHC